MHPQVEMVQAVASPRLVEIRRDPWVSLGVKEYEDGLRLPHCYEMGDEDRVVVCLGS